MSLDVSAVQANPAETFEAGYGASLSTAVGFNQALGAAEAAPGTSAAVPTASGPGGLQAVQGAMKEMMQTLEGVNGEAADLGRAAASAQARGSNLSAGEMVMLTMRCQEFMFHCQLTSNIANRTSDGLQQLFRQQG